MEGLAPRGDTEEYVLDELKRPGWTITGTQRDGADLDISVEYRGVPGRIRFRHGSNRAKATLGPAETTSPCFVRLDLGEPSGEPEQWALWDRYEVHSSGKTGSGPSWSCLVVHEAMGEQWVSVACNKALPGGASWVELYAANALVVRAEALCPGRDPAARREAMFEVQRKNYGPQRDRRKKLIFGVVFFVIALGPTSLALLSPSLVLLKALFLFFLSALFLLVSLLVVVAALLGTRTKPLEGARELVDRIRKTGAFEKLKLSRAQHREGFRVVIHEGRNLAKGAAPLWISRITGRSQTHPIRFEADLCEVKWPPGTEQDCRFLPDRWLLVDLTGPEAEMSRLPSGPREMRRPQHIRWLFTGEEVGQRLVDELLRRVVQPADESAGPYR